MWRTGVEVIFYSLFTFMMQQGVSVCVQVATILLKSTKSLEAKPVCLAPVYSHADLTDTGLGALEQYYFHCFGQHIL